MPKSKPLLPGPPGLAGALALTAGLGSAGLAGNGLQWRLTARVPVMCAILETAARAERPADLVVTTICNAERFRLVLHDGPEAAGLRTAHSSAGPVQISGAAVTITSTQPGRAVTTIELAAPVDAAQLAITLEPLQ